MADSTVVEWAPFELAPGADAAQFLAASQALQSEFLSRQTGFIRRELLKGGDNRWVDLVYWQNEAAAQRAMQNVASSSACQRYFQLMANADGASVALFFRLQSYA